ncbi:MAG: hypothetical protein AB7F36_09225 [Reyranellaceae bacterium]
MSPRAALAPERIEAGERLLRRLEERGANVPAALWSYAPDINEWRLYLAIRHGAQQGLAASTEMVSQAIASLRSEEDFPLTRQDISPVATDHAVIATLAAAIGTGPTISRLRIQGTRVNGALIEDALVYRLYKAGLAG